MSDTEQTDARALALALADDDAARGARGTVDRPSCIWYTQCHTRPTRRRLVMPDPRPPRDRCPRAADCRAQGQDGWYCPCRVRGLLAAYAELLNAGDVLTGGGGGHRDRVRGALPAYTLQEEAVCTRADLAAALAWLCATYPATGDAVARAYGLRVVGRRVTFVGEVDDAGRVVPRRLGAIRDGWARGQRRPVPARQFVADLVGQGIAALAYHLGWRPGLAGDAATLPARIGGARDAESR